MQSRFHPPWVAKPAMKTGVNGRAPQTRSESPGARGLHGNHDSRPPLPTPWWATRTIAPALTSSATRSASLGTGTAVVDEGSAHMYATYASDRACSSGSRRAAPPAFTCSTWAAPYPPASERLCVVKPCAGCGPADAPIAESEADQRGVQKAALPVYAEPVGADGVVLARARAVGRLNDPDVAFAIAGAAPAREEKQSCGSRASD